VSYAIKKDGSAWRSVNGPADVGPDENYSTSQPAPFDDSRARAKIDRNEAVARIKVTVGNLVFDGDEASQGRMARAILGMQIAAATEIEWTLADNTHATVTLAQLSQALVLAGAEQARLWPI